MSPLEKAAGRALKAALSAMEGDAPWQRADLALTIHMLEFLAPRFFAEKKLAAASDAALKALQKIPAGFGVRLGGDEAMARLDGLYLSAVRGRCVRTFDRAALKRFIEQGEQKEGRLWRWLMGELAAKVGVDAALPLDGHWAFRQHPILHLYHLTHVVLLDTEYLMKPVPERLGKELEQLQLATDRLIQVEAWDLLAECVMCLSRAGTSSRPAIEALLGAQRRDGSFAERTASAREAAHCTAASFLALAGALDLERSAP